MLKKLVLEDDFSKAFSYLEESTDGFRGPKLRHGSEVPFSHRVPTPPQIQQTITEGQCPFVKCEKYEITLHAVDPNPKYFTFYQKGILS